MKPFHILVGLGLVLILGVAGWYMYLSSVPNFPKAETRGIDLPMAPKKKAAAMKAKPAGDGGAVPDAAPATPDGSPKNDGEAEPGKAAPEADAG